MGMHTAFAMSVWYSKPEPGQESKSLKSWPHKTIGFVCGCFLFYAVFYILPLLLGTAPQFYFADIFLGEEEEL